MINDFACSFFVERGKGHQSKSKSVVVWQKVLCCIVNDCLAKKHLSPQLNSLGLIKEEIIFTLYIFSATYKLLWPEKNLISKLAEVQYHSLLYICRFSCKINGF